MISKIKRTVAATFVLSFLAMALVPATTGAAAIQQAACQGSELTFTSDYDSNDPTKIDPESCKYEGQEGQGPERINTLITDIINIFSVIVGIVAVIMIIYGGFRYMTSGGDSGKVADARNTILYAIVGLIIVVFAQFIVKFVLAKITGSG